MSKQRVNSREKGKQGEREVAALLRDAGLGGRRGVQSAGAGAAAVVGGQQASSADVLHDVPWLHVEVKRTARLGVHDALEQAARDAREGETPTVWWRPNREGWVVTVRAEDFLRLVREGLLGP